jgi:hypothetical protein
LLTVIVVVDYDPTWPEQFEQLRREYAGAMAAAGVPVVASSMSAALLFLASLPSPSSTATSWSPRTT